VDINKKSDNATAEENASSPEQNTDNLVESNVSNTVQ